jgi:membrane protein
VASTSPTAAGLSRRVGEGGRKSYRLGRELVGRFGERDLLTYASAISFQVLFSLVPLALAGLALLAFMGLEETWNDRIAPEAEDNLPGDAYSLIDRTVKHVLGEQRGFWLTLGFAFATWQVSGAIRAASGALNDIYSVTEERSWLKRIALSLVLALALMPLLIGAVAAIGFGDRLLSEVGIDGVAGFLADMARWVLGIACMLTAVWLVVRWAPAEPPPKARWVTLGTGLTVGSWLIASGLYGVYITHVASYGSMFGALASIIVLMTYIYILSVVFLGGVQLDGMAREHNGVETSPDA